MPDQLTMAIDQYGTTYHNLGAYPRKTLLERLGSRSAEKMYMDDSTGESQHVGYIINRLWLTLYKIEPWAGRFS
jgi:hypothetical protein